MNDEIHTAANVTKTSTSNVATFQSPQYGPIGIVTKELIVFPSRHFKAGTLSCYQINRMSIFLRHMLEWMAD